MTRSNALIRNWENASLKIFLKVAAWMERGRPKPSEPMGPQRALICKWCCMGDAILTLYAIREFKRVHPEIILDVLISSRIQEVYRRAPEIDHVFVLPITGRRLYLELLNPQLWLRMASLMLTLRKNRYAQFIDLELYRGTGPVLKRLIGNPFSRGFQVEGAVPKGHEWEVPRPKTMPEWQCFYQVLGLEIPPEIPAPLFTAPIRVTSAAPGKTRRVGIVYGSSFNWPQKKWPWEYYADTISLLQSDGHEFVLFGSEFEKDEAGKIAARAKGKVVNTTGELDWDGLQAQVASCDLVLGNDTGTMHLASACGVPTLTLFGPTDPRKWNGLTSSSLFLESVPCRPCYYLSSMPPCDHFSCLRKMDPGMVAEKIRARLAQLEIAEKKAILNPF